MATGGVCDLRACRAIRHVRGSHSCPDDDEILAAPRHDDVMRGFERIEREDAGAGALERFHALAGRLEREAQSLGA